MKLKCWASDWGLPSIDIDCLSVLTYAYIANVPITKLDSLPRNTISGTLPELEDNDLVHSQPFDIISAFRREGFNADYGLSMDQDADTLAYLASIEQRLRPAILYALWLDIENYEKIIRPAFGKACGFPWSLWYPHRMQQSIEEFIGQFKQTECLEGLKNLEKILYRDAQFCLNLFEKRLGNSLYFFGDTPSTFDAILYGHLGVLSRAPLCSTELQNHLHACEHLKSFCLRIERHFPGKEPTPDLPKTVPEKQFLKKNQIISVVVAVTAMITYALTSGLMTSKRSKLAQKLKHYQTNNAHDPMIELDQLE